MAMMGGFAPLTTATLLIGAAASGSAVSVLDPSCRSGEAAAGPVLLQRSAQLQEGSLEVALAGGCDEASWPDKDHGLVCGECKVLVDRFNIYKTCSGYCTSIGRQCTGAWEEQNDDCTVKYPMTCDQTIASSDAICECGAEAGPTPSPAAPAPACYGDLGDLAVEEGGGAGASVDTASAAECQEVCNGSPACNSFSLCPQWGCFLLRRSFSGGEATRSHGGCRTYYKKPCGGAASPALAPAPSTTAGTVTVTVKVMSYNTEYIGYPPRGASRIDQYGAKIREVGAAIVGTQECLDRFALGAASGYSPIPGIEGWNPILFDPSKVSYVEGTSGYMAIPRDNYAERFFTWAQFTAGGSAWWFFNTHMPHNHNEATSPNTHARIAQMLLQKFRDLGITNSPTVVVGDFNPFASNGASEGSFESNLVAGGFFRVYKARGNPGYPGLDKIFASSAHWESSNGADHGTGGSDHPAIAADLMLRA